MWMEICRAIGMIHTRRRNYFTSGRGEPLECWKFFTNENIKRHTDRNEVFVWRRSRSSLVAVVVVDVTRRGRGNGPKMLFAFENKTIRYIFVCATVWLCVRVTGERTPSTCYTVSHLSFDCSVVRTTKNSLLRALHRIEEMPCAYMRCCMNIYISMVETGRHWATILIPMGTYLSYTGERTRSKVRCLQSLRRKRVYFIFVRFSSIVLFNRVHEMNDRTR